MANSTNPAPSSAPLGTISGSGSNSSTKAAVFGYILGLATAGILYVVSGKGKRSKANRSAVRPEPHDEPTLVPQSSPAVDGHDCVPEVEEPTPAPAGAAKRKLTDEDVALIRAWYDGGVPAREIAARLGISVKTVYSRLKKNNNPENPKNDDR